MGIEKRSKNYNVSISFVNKNLRGFLIALQPVKAPKNPAQKILPIWKPVSDLIFPPVQKQWPHGFQFILEPRPINNPGREHKDGWLPDFGSDLFSQKNVLLHKLGATLKETHKDVNWLKKDPKVFMLERFLSFYSDFEYLT